MHGSLFEVLCVREGEPCSYDSFLSLSEINEIITARALHYFSKQCVLCKFTMYIFVRL